METDSVGGNEMTGEMFAVYGTYHGDPLLVLYKTIEEARQDIAALTVGDENSRLDIMKIVGAHWDEIDAEVVHLG